jgi:hypothetical protein
LDPFRRVCLTENGFRVGIDHFELASAGSHETSGTCGIRRHDHRQAVDVDARATAPAARHRPPGRTEASARAAQSGADNSRRENGWRVGGSSRSFQNNAPFPTVRRQSCCGSRRRRRTLLWIEEKSELATTELATLLWHRDPAFRRRPRRRCPRHLATLLWRRDDPAGASRLL